MPHRRHGRLNFVGLSAYSFGTLLMVSIVLKCFHPQGRLFYVPRNHKQRLRASTFSLVLVLQLVCPRDHACVCSTRPVIGCSRLASGMSFIEVALYILLVAYGMLKLLASAGRWRARRRYGVASEALVIGFFHPFCCGGGGGERVLWRAVRALADVSKDLRQPLHVLIYTGDVGASPEDILFGVKRQFDISVDAEALPVSFVYLSTRNFLDPGNYPIFTILAQSLASMFLAAEALLRATPGIFMDTTGFAFSYPIAWLAGCRVGAYVHYPTISTDMLSRVRTQRPSHNNSSWISSSVAVSRAKLLYYHAFAASYGIVGRFASCVMVNSSWTREHIVALWKRASPTVVFPPCDTSELESLPINEEGRELCALSVGQFRPEKDHALQVRALAALRNLHDSEAGSASGDHADNKGCSAFNDVRLVILGSCRSDDDRGVLKRTRALAVELGVEEQVEFVVNCSFEELKAWLGRASVGLHTMWNEHFGIGVVEMMAAGMITIAHRSGGPAADIIVPLPDGRITGFLAETPEEYAMAMARVFGSRSVPTNKTAIRIAGRESARRFSNDVFDSSFRAEFTRLMRPKSAPQDARKHD